ncbi:hypothetical protein HYS94_02500 [Candidatus Daviesbacteria bacterium]|nr:hypothetical protein [Candidatus Daviesbacteria bacterium]
MIAKLLISPSLEDIKKEIDQTLRSHLGSGNTNHPDVLYFNADSKLGIAEARKIKEHFSLKPYSAKGRAVVLEDASNLTIEAQNALLKTLEELPKEGLFILGVDNESKLLPTIISRCQVIHIPEVSSYPTPGVGIYIADIERLLRISIEERFEYIEKLKDREEFLYALVNYFHKNLASHIQSGSTDFIKELLQAEEWANQNVNIRAILEYLMLVMPSK